MYKPSMENAQIYLNPRMTSARNTDIDEVPPSAKNRASANELPERTQSVRSNRVAQPDDRADIPALDKIPTNAFIENFLDDGGDQPGPGAGEADDGPELAREATDVKKWPKAEPLPDDQDDLETVLDVNESFPSFDDTGQTAYHRACKRFGTLPSSSFYKKLGYASTIDMKHYNVGPRGAISLAVPMVINTKITTLNLKGNDLSKDGINAIGKMMQENTSITDLILSENCLKTYGLQVVSEILQENQSIRLLDISDNQFSDSDASIISKAVEEHPNLKILNLSHNNFGDLAAAHLGRMISENGTLHELDLSWNHLRGRGAVAVANGVRDNIGLKILNLEWNGFGDEGAVAMSCAMKTCTLVELDLGNNRVGADGFVNMIKALKNNDELKKLKLRKNPIPEEAAQAGIDFIREKMDPSELHLELLDLGDVMLSSTFAESVAATTAVHDKFECPFGYTDSYGKRKLKQYNIVEEAMNALAKYAEENNMNIIDLFARFDEDGSMSVSHDEFKIGLKEAKVPVTDEQITSLINALDEDGDGEIDFSEMVMGVEQYKTT